MREISVGLNGLSKPLDRLLVIMDADLRHACETHPGESSRISRTKAQGLDNMGLRFVRPADKQLAISNEGVDVGKISIQLQRAFASGDALGSPPGPDLDESEPHLALRVIGSQGQRAGQFRFGRYEGGDGLGRQGRCGFDCVRRR